MTEWGWVIEEENWISEINAQLNINERFLKASLLYVYNLQTIGLLAIFHNYINAKVPYNLQEKEIYLMIREMLLGIMEYHEKIWLGIVLSNNDWNVQRSIDWKVNTMLKLNYVLNSQIIVAIVCMRVYSLWLQTHEV